VNPKSVIYWFLAALILVVLNYFYNPGLLLAGIGSLLSLGLLVLLVWAQKRIGAGPKALIASLITSVVAGFMISKALDVSYAILGAPEGLRLAVGLEVALFALVLALGTLAAHLVLRPEKEK
jgi:hypothetical protein